MCQLHIKCFIWNSSPLYKWGSGGKERRCNLPKAAQLFVVESAWNPGHSDLTLTFCPFCHLASRRLGHHIWDVWTSAPGPPPEEVTGLFLWQSRNQPAECGCQRAPHEARGPLPARGQHPGAGAAARGEQAPGLQLLQDLLHAGERCSSGFLGDGARVGSAAAYRPLTGPNPPDCLRNRNSGGMVVFRGKNLFCKNSW